MNILKLIENEISNKDLNDLEKIRYIYIRCCELFSFDTRYYYASLFNDFDLFKEICTKKIDIDNVESPLVTCYTFSNYIMKPLIENITSLDVKLVDLIKHVYITVPKYHIELDATLSDLSRIKINFIPLYFNSKNISDIKLNEIDKKLGYTFLDDRDYVLKRKKASVDDMIKINDVIKNNKFNLEFSDIDYLVNHYLFYHDFELLPCITYANDHYEYFKFYGVGNNLVVLSLKDGMYLLQETNENEYNKISENCKTRKKSRIIS